jgi:simple sugar transport system substrate-binding protein
MKCIKQFAGAMITTTAVFVWATATLAAEIAIVGGKADDPFFAIVKRGIDDAARSSSREVAR